MAQTQRSTSEIYTLLADNVTGNISPQDIRDAFASWRMGHGQIYVPATAAAAITIANTTDYVECTAPVWTLSAGGHLFDESAGNGRLTYTGLATSYMHIAYSYSMTTASNNQVTHFRIGKNGITDEASEVQRKVGTGADVGAGACHLVTSMSTGDYLSVWVRNSTSASDVTLVCCNLQAVSMIA